MIKSLFFMSLRHPCIPSTFLSITFIIVLSYYILKHSFFLFNFCIVTSVSSFSSSAAISLSVFSVILHLMLHLKLIKLDHQPINTCVFFALVYLKPSFFKICLTRLLLINLKLNQQYASSLYHLSNFVFSNWFFYFYYGYPILTYINCTWFLFLYSRNDRRRKFTIALFYCIVSYLVYIPLILCF